MVLDKYSYLKEELLRCIDSVVAIEGISGCPCEELREKIQNNVFNLIVLGQFKRGKTSLINVMSNYYPVHSFNATTFSTKELRTIIKKDGQLIFRSYIFNPSLKILPEIFGWREEF